MDFDTYFCEQAYMRACEIDSPNSPDFETILESVHDDVVFTGKCWEEHLRQRAAFLTPEQIHELRTAQGR